jgi:hypothetical protein
VAQRSEARGGAVGRDGGGHFDSDSSATMYHTRVYVVCRCRVLMLALALAIVRRAEGFVQDIGRVSSSGSLLDRR